ncbi:MAG: hypothetical protein OIN66_00610 [Candidatus Methanoperedens sp.]|nr:hypothetical protein [Candidatus Methanoperedens sp.]
MSQDGSAPAYRRAAEGSAKPNPCGDGAPRSVGRRPCELRSIAAFLKIGVLFCGIMPAQLSLHK